MLKILVVEDEIDVLCAIRMLQRERLCHVQMDEVRNVKAFWDKFTPGKYDAILLDLRLPPDMKTQQIDDMAGVVIAEKLELMNQSIPIVVLTAWPEINDWRKRLEKIDAVKHILKKPVSFDQLSSALEEAIGGTEKR